MLVFKQRPAGFHRKASPGENIRILSENAPDPFSLRLKKVQADTFNLPLVLPWKNYFFCLKNMPEYPLAGVPRVISKINWQIGIPGVKRILNSP